MAGCLKALGFWRKKSKADSASSISEKYPEPHRGRTRTTVTPDPEKPPLKAHHARVAFPSTGIPIRPYVNPTPYSFDDGAKLKDEGVDDPEEVARRKKAAQEEQERLDFFQML